MKRNAQIVIGVGVGWMLTLALAAAMGYLLAPSTVATSADRRESPRVGPGTEAPGAMAYLAERSEERRGNGGPRGRGDDRDWGMMRDAYAALR